MRGDLLRNRHETRFLPHEKLGSLYINRLAAANGKSPCIASLVMLCQDYSRGRGEMSDKSDKPAQVPDMTGGKTQGDDAPEDVVASLDGEIDLARLAPQLRGLYQELLSEPIPDRFTKLLDELAGKETDKP
jgi:hypothetical protein